MRKVFEVELASEDRCTELILPASPYALLDALEKLELREGEVPQWEVIQTHSCDKLYPYLDQDGTLSELNALCQQLALLDERQTAIVEGLVKIEFEEGNRPVPMSRLIDMAYGDSHGGAFTPYGYVKRWESVDRRSQKYQVNTFRRKQRPAPFRSRKRGLFISGWENSGTKFRKWK